MDGWEGGRERERGRREGGDRDEGKKGARKGKGDKQTKRAGMKPHSERRELS